MQTMEESCATFTASADKMQTAAQIHTTLLAWFENHMQHVDIQLKAYYKDVPPPFPS